MEEKISKEALFILNDTKQKAKDFLMEVKNKNQYINQDVASKIIGEGKLIYNNSISLIKENKTSVLAYYQMQETAFWKYLEGTEIDKIYFKQIAQTEKVKNNIAYLSEQEDILILRLAEIRDCIRKIIEHDKSLLKNKFSCIL